MNPLYAFILTFAIEFAIFCLFLKKNYLQTFFYVFLINAFTWPLANLAYDFWRNFYLIELGVFVVEGFLIKLLFKMNYKKAFLISFIANFVSALAGYLFL